MRQRARVDNLTICYSKKQIEVSFYARVLKLTMNFVITCQSSLRINPAIASWINLVPIVLSPPPWERGCSWIHNYFDIVMTKFMINRSTDACKTDIDLLN